MGQLRFDVIGGGQTLVQGDLDAAPGAEIEILLQGVYDLTRFDFVL